MPLKSGAVSSVSNLNEPLETEGEEGLSFPLRLSRVKTNPHVGGKSYCIPILSGCHPVREYGADLRFGSSRLCTNQPTKSGVKQHENSQ